MLAAFADARRATTLEVMRPVASLERFLDAARIEHGMRAAPHDTGHAVVRNPALRSWSQRIGLWHVDHF